MSRRDGNKANRRRKHDDRWTRKLMNELKAERNRRPLYVIAVKRDGEQAGVGVERYVSGQLTWFASWYWCCGRASIDSLYRRAIMKVVERDGAADVVVPLRWLDELQVDGARVESGQRGQFDRAFDLARDALKRKSSVEETL